MFDLYKKAEEKIIVVAHRGAFGGNIPCNTIPAYRAALMAGADMIEIDVDMSRDGKLMIFHPGMEPAFLGIKTRIPDMTQEEISNLRYLNYDNTPTQFKINTLEEILEEFKGKCFINVDKFWGHPKEIYEEIKRHNMIDQILVKSSVNDSVIGVLKDLAPDVAYMPIVKKTHPRHEELLKSGIKYVGVECLFTDEADEVCTESFIERMHRDNVLVWANAIIYNYKDQLSAGHSDDTAICESADKGWGWLAKRGFDFIQTDWTAAMTKYLAENNLLYRKSK